VRDAMTTTEAQYWNIWQFISHMNIVDIFVNAATNCRTLKALISDAPVKSATSNSA
jgi:hypothetical protein